MNFPRALACLLLLTAQDARAFQAEEIVRGGGALTLDGTAYRFEPAAVMAVPAGNGLPALIRLTGRLVPEGPGAPFELQLTVMKTGGIYMLRILRDKPGGYPDSWSATQKTRARIVQFEDRSGGRLELACSGSLTGIVARRPRNAEWRGSLWMMLP
ncbi:hypothetical protein [Geothrix sp. 21YS21S-4]|uniref:hypothetical protein n=1 Tax=Geothrix sp. 21YS21S-4 TaxID=3068889 RepID=UPI0027B953E5|nr:hypothetical protein [Geothrix sp. 21YS21S-4]